jgi:hypothetical protein
VKALETQLGVMSLERDALVKEKKVLVMDKFKNFQNVRRLQEENTNHKANEVNFRNAFGVGMSGWDGTVDALDLEYQERELAQFDSGTAQP